LAGIDGKIADVFNEVLEVRRAPSDRDFRASAASSARRASSSSGMNVPGAVGGWADEVVALNTLIDDLGLADHRSHARHRAVAKGDLGQAIALEVDGRPLEGEFLHSAQLGQSHDRSAVGLHF